MFRPDIQRDEPIETFENNDEDEQGVKGDSENVVGLRLLNYGPKSWSIAHPTSCDQ